MATIRVTWDNAAIKLDCERPSGPIDRAMSQLADAAVLSMKYRCPVYTGPPRGPTPGHPRQTARRSGTLRSSIRKLRQPSGDYLIGPTDLVGGQLLGPLIEGGTPAHTIRSHGRWSLYSASSGQYFGPVVHHPGTQPHKFIEPAARDLNGKRITIRLEETGHAARSSRGWPGP